MSSDKDVKATSKNETFPQASINDVFSFARTRRIKLCIAGSFASACVSGTALPAIAFYFAKAFEDLARSTSSDIFMSAIRRIAYTFMILGVIIMASMTIQAMLQETAAGEMTNLMKKSWFEALLRQDMAYHDMRDVAGQATIITSSGNKFKKGVGRKLSEAVQFTITFVGAIGYAFYATWKLSLAVLAAAPFLAYSIWFSIKLISTQTSRANAIYAKAGGIVTRSMTNIRTILSLNAVQRMIDEYKAATEDAMTGSISITWVIGCATGAEFAASYIAYIIVTLLGSWLLYSNVQDTGCDPSGTVEGVERCDPAGMDIMGALMGVSFASGILPQVSVAIESLSGARSACYPALVAMSRNVKDSPIDIDIERQENDFEVIDRQSNTLTEQAPLPDYVIDSSSDAGHKPKTISGGIEFVNVNFSYPARKDSRVLSSFSLRVEAGKTVALVGASGSGKSTTLSLLERFYDPSGGSITLDGTDLRLLNVKWLREQIGLVLQEPKLFAKSIRENIAMGRPGATIKDIEEAARMANAYDFIMSFPRAFETQVGEMGAQLSGGQRQRIAIARVLLKNPKILLLDEATSALDSESEVTVQQALDKLLKLTSMTTIVIAHRLSTIRNADLIAVVQDGAVVETGTHDSLLANGGAYYHLVQAQKTKQNVLAEETLKILEDDLQLGGSLDGAFPELEMEESSIDRNVAIRFSEVSFRYPARPEAQVLRNLDLTVWEGETVALVGASGSGKSTVIQLMEGFYRPDSGKIEYCGKDVRNICVRWLRDELGLVSQEATLFEGSIADNIRFGCPGATEEQIIEAAKQANCHNFITEFPYGYETVVKDGGILVSGGQKQRIAIARALIKKPKVLLLDEATSALDSESEKLVQVALEAIMARKDQTCIVIAHRLSTVRDADRIAVIDQGSVIEIGTHEMLMNKPDGKYRRLQAMQDLGSYVKGMDPGRQQDISIVVAENALPSKSVEKEDDAPLTKEEVAANSKRAWLMGASDWPYLVIGTIGALLAGLNFPCMGWVWAYMTELLYQRVETCPPAAAMLGFGDCDTYYDSVADDMRQMSFYLTYGFIGLAVASLVGMSITFWGFGSAAEKMNKRVRDAAFSSMIRQEIAWHDLRSPGELSSQLADDTALLRAFAGEPIRSLALSLSSVFVGLIISFIYMWPFALLILVILPFLSFGAMMEMKMSLGTDEGDESTPDETSSGAILIETLSNIRTVASLGLETSLLKDYDRALEREDAHPVRTNLIKGLAAGVGQLTQMWSMALMFWWGGWLMANYSSTFTYRAFLIAMFSLFMSIYGLTIAALGAADREQAKAAAARIFALIDRQSQIDPLGNKGE